MIRSPDRDLIDFDGNQKLVNNPGDLRCDVFA